MELETINKFHYLFEKLRADGYEPTLKINRHNAIILSVTVTEGDIYKMKNTLDYYKGIAGT